MRPPWQVQPEIEPEDIYWRMGEGEGYVTCWLVWAEGIGPEALRRFLLSQRPIPEPWIWFAAEAYALPSIEEEDIDAAYEALIAP